MSVCFGATSDQLGSRAYRQLGAESWRVALCRRAAEWMAQALRTRLDEQDVTRYTLARLELAGVDVARFGPKRLAAPSPPPTSARVA